MGNIGEPKDGDIAAEIKMVRARVSGAILVVEGDSDLTVFDRFTCSDASEIVVAHGKDNVLSAMMRLQMQGDDKGVVAVVDSDYWKMAQVLPVPYNVILTPYHDMEVSMLNSDALPRFLGLFGSSGKIARFLSKTRFSSIREALLDRALPLGRLRWLSFSKQLNLTFKSLASNIDSSISGSDLALNMRRVLISVIRDTPGCHMPPAELESAISDEGMLYPREQVCSGHDMMHILAKGLRKALGNADSRIGNKDHVEKIMRAAYGVDDFRGSSLCFSLCVWENSNQPYRLLKDICRSFG